MNKLIAFLITVFLMSCSGHKPIVLPDFVPGPKTIIYKANANLYDKVPVSLSEDKTSITSFPHPKDLIFKGQLALPTKLVKGYYLDNRGVGPNTAFLKYSYQEYAALKKLPNPDELFMAIIDNNPMQEIFECGMRSEFKDIKELNKLVKNGFAGVKKVK